MQNFKETGFIKSYPALLKLPITISEKSFLELVLSFTDKGNTFYMNYNAIAQYLGFQNVQSVKNVAHSLRKKGYITTNQSHNFNGSAGGSSTSIVINEELINLQLKSILKEEQESIRSILSNNNNTTNKSTGSSEIVDENEDNDLKFSYQKMAVMSEKHQVIKDLILTNFPNEGIIEITEEDRLKFLDFLKSVHSNAIMKVDELKEFYRRIEIDDYQESEN